MTVSEMWLGATYIGHVRCGSNRMMTPRLKVLERPSENEYASESWFRSIDWTTIQQYHSGGILEKHIGTGTAEEAKRWWKETSHRRLLSLQAGSGDWVSP